MRKNWFALYTKPRNEFKAAQQLKEINVDYYLATYFRMRQWSDRKKKIEEPVLKSYIFIYADERQRLDALELQAISRCVFDKGRPAVIPEWQIDNLKNFLAAEAEFKVHNLILPGTEVLIQDGPFAGTKGVILKTKKSKDLAVTIEWINRTITAHLSEDTKFEIIKKKK
jgi:transcriptional antiterminator RfaH